MYGPGSPGGLRKWYGRLRPLRFRSGTPPPASRPTGRWGRPYARSGSGLGYRSALTGGPLFARSATAHSLRPRRPGHRARRRGSLGKPPLARPLSVPWRHGTQPGGGEYVPTYVEGEGSTPPPLHPHGSTPCSFGPATNTPSDSTSSPPLSAFLTCVRPASPDAAYPLLASQRPAAVWFFLSAGGAATSW